MAMLNNQRVILIVILIVTKCHQPFILLDDHLLWEELHSIVSELSQSKAAVEQPALPALVVTGLAQWKRRWEVVFLGWMIPISYEYVYIIYIYMNI